MKRGYFQTILVPVGAIGILLTACSVVDAPIPTVPVAETTTTVAITTTTTEPPRVCTAPPVSEPPELFGSAAAQSVVLSRSMFSCADTVYVMAPADAEAYAVSAAANNAPLLIFEPAVRDEILGELERLSPASVAVTDLALLADLDIPVEEVTPVGATTFEKVWLLPETTVDQTLLTYTAALAGAHVIANVAIADFTADQVAAISGATVETFGTLDPTDEWRLGNLRAGVTTVNGTANLLDDTRFLAFYGNPTTPFLGVLGEQGPSATLERMQPFVEEYTTDGVLVVPTFEIIATVADAVAGSDEDYSAEMDPSLATPWVELAAANGGYVVLDLQPGRTDFLTQAKRYEELLKLPNVGLALDPEWRLEPHEFHLRQIGSVTGAEINLVSEWLADLVRTENLPQKMFLLHQFRFDMITERETIEIRPELATVIQMDGQGPLPTKYETFGALTAPADAAKFAWGWKNFFDEDSPMAAAAQILDLEPTLVFISFQ